MSKFIDPRGGLSFEHGRGGIFGGRFKVQCQIYFKIGHDSSVCYHRHTSVMPSMITSPCNYFSPSSRPSWNQWTNPNLSQSVPVSTMVVLNHNRWLAPPTMVVPNQNQWSSQAPMGPPPGFAPKPSYQPQAHFIVHVLRHLVLILCSLKSGF